MTAVNFVVQEYNRRENDDHDDPYSILVKVHEASVKVSVSMNRFLLQQQRTTSMDSIMITEQTG